MVNYLNVGDATPASSTKLTGSASHCSGAANQRAGEWLVSRPSVASG